MQVKHEEDVFLHLYLCHYLSFKKEFQYAKNENPQRCEEKIQSHEERKDQAQKGRPQASSYRDVRESRPPSQKDGSPQSRGNEADKEVHAVRFLIIKQETG